MIDSTDEIRLPDTHLDDDALALAARVTQRLRESQRLRPATARLSPPTVATRRITPPPG